MNRDAFAWAQWQIALDAQDNARFPDILERKKTKLYSSPFSFFRGTAPLFYRALAEIPLFFDVPRDEGLVLGDAHLENFGAFRLLGADTDEKRLVFDTNDFDEIGFAPLALDPVRLGASLLLAAREHHLPGVDAARLLQLQIDAYADARHGEEKPIDVPECVKKLLNRVEKRTKGDFLDKRTSLNGSRRKFLRGDRYADVPLSWSATLEAAVPSYVETLRAPDSFPSECRELEDVAFRIAGTGSLGCVRAASLHRGKGGPDGAWLLDWKEERVPALSHFAPQSGEPQGRIVRGIDQFLEGRPWMLGEASIDFEGVGPLNYVVRRLTPQEDKLALGRLEAKDLSPLVRYLGALLGRHQKRALSTPAPPLSPSEREGLVVSATRLAGFFEDVFLAYCACSV